MENKINVLSLFDGISCGQIALEKAGISVGNYYASEIDKHAIKVTQSNYPDTVQLGDVTKVSANDLPKINLLIGGSPCQGFSFSGKQLNFDDPRSALFFEYIRLMKECQPRFFLLENVIMNKQCQDIISENLGVNPVLINSKYFTPQSRNRLYWTNIPVADYSRNIHTLKEITGKEEDLIPNDQLQEQVSKLLATSKYRDSFKINRGKDGRCVVKRPDGLKIQRIGRIAHSNSIVEILTKSGSPFIECAGKIRKINRLESERLQSVPDGYTSVIGETAAKQALGNGWTIDVIEHIFKGMKPDLCYNPVIT